MGVKTTAFLVFGAVVVALIAMGLLAPPPSAPEIHEGWFGMGRIRSADDKSIRRFKVEVPDDVLDDLHERLNRARLHDELEDVQFQYGMRQTFLAEVVKYWRDQYDWRKHEAILNEHPQFKTQIEGIDVHFLHIKPKGLIPGKKPMLITHGWPGSIWEFYKLIPRLTEPEKFGGKKEDALEVICPSIPGYGYSEKPHHQGFSQAAAARVFVTLMKRLGHERFYIQGGDWGALISVIMAQLYPENIAGLHLNMFPIPMANPMLIGHQIVASLAPSFFLDADDQKRLRAITNFADLLQETGYMHIQATKPDTVGTALHDSPVGLAAYILEKFSTWTDADYINLPDGGILKKFSLDELLTNIMIYWTTGTITSSQRFYKEFFRDGNIMILDKVPVTVPTGLAAFPHELFTAPKAFLGYKYKNIIQYTVMPDGGHFAAFEQPKLMAEDILNFIRKIQQLGV